MIKALKVGAIMFLVGYCTQGFYCTHFEETIVIRDTTVIHDTIIKPQFLCFRAGDFKTCKESVNYLANFNRP